jgi:cupin superfamily acireductone dioxygenase involved in methionine salvage
MEKPNRMLQNKILNTIKKFSVRGKYRIVGSNATRGSLYSVDYDTNSKIEGVDILTHIQNLYKHPPAIITDFKTGSLHWTREQVLKGRHGNHLLADELKKNHMIKLDFVVQTPELAECSEVYFYTEPKKTDVIKQLEADIDAYLDTDTMKSLKRLVSIMKYKKGNEEMIQKFLDFFNTEVGLINYCIAGLGTLEMVKKDIDVKPYREMIKEKLGRTSVPAKYVKGTHANIPHLRKIVNEASLAFLRELIK